MGEPDERAATGREKELVDCARKVTAAELERVVRSWPATSRLDEAELERRRHRRRYLAVVPDGDGMYTIHGRLDPEVGALLMRAIEAAGDALYRSEKDWAPKGGARGPRTEETTARQRRADALGLLAERAMAAGFGRAPRRGGRPTPRRERDGPDVGDACTCDRGPDDEDPLSGTRVHRYQVFHHVDSDTLRRDGPGGRSTLEDGTRVSAETSRRLTCDAAVVEVERGADGSVLKGARPASATSCCSAFATTGPSMRRASGSAA